VVTSYPLRVVLHNPNATGNIAKLAVELGEFELDFVSCHAIKSLVLTDFVTDWTPLPSQSGGPDGSAPEPPASVFSGLIGSSFLTDPRISRGPVREPCSLLQMGNSSNTWCT
jgi:hypothetical protein